jgi:hypothetical protein
LEDFQSSLYIHELVLNDFFLIAFSISQLVPQALPTCSQRVADSIDNFLVNLDFHI